MAQANGYIRKITLRDEKLLTQLAKTGIASIEQAEKYCDVKIKRLKRLERSKYIILIAITHNSENELLLIELGGKGKLYLKNELKINTFIKSNKTHGIENDILFTEKYYNCVVNFKGGFNISQLAKEIYYGNLYISDINMKRYFFQYDDRRIDILCKIRDMMNNNKPIIKVFMYFLNDLFFCLKEYNKKSVTVAKIKFKILLDIIEIIPISLNVIFLKYVLNTFNNFIYYEYFFETKSFLFNIEEFNIPIGKFKFLFEKCKYFNSYHYLHQFLLDIDCSEHFF